MRAFRNHRYIYNKKVTTRTGHGTPSMEPRAWNPGHGTPGMEPRASNRGHRTAGIEPRASLYSLYFTVIYTYFFM